MQGPLSSHDSGTEGKRSSTRISSTACFLGSQLREHRQEGQRCELLAARRRANRQRFLGADGAFVGECASGFCGTDCTRCTKSDRWKWTPAVVNALPDAHVPIATKPSAHCSEKNPLANDSDAHFLLDCPHVQMREPAGAADF